MPVTTLRIWERRYGVVAPPKSESVQRLYSEDDVRRLTLLKGLVKRGHPIATIAKIDSAQLERLALNRTDKELAQLAAGAATQMTDIALAVAGTALVQRLEAEDCGLLEAGIASMAEFASLDDATAHAKVSARWCRRACGRELRAVTTSARCPVSCARKASPIRAARYEAAGVNGGVSRVA